MSITSTQRSSTLQTSLRPDHLQVKKTATFYTQLELQTATHETTFITTTLPASRHQTVTMSTYLTLITAHLCAISISTLSTASIFADLNNILDAWEQAMTLVYILASYQYTFQRPSTNFTSSVLNTTRMSLRATTKTRIIKTDTTACDPGLEKLPSIVEMPMGGMQCAVM